jgi:hypothetical protein
VHDTASVLVGARWTQKTEEHGWLLERSSKSEASYLILCCWLSGRGGEAGGMRGCRIAQRASDAEPIAASPTCVVVALLRGWLEYLSAYYGLWLPEASVTATQHRSPASTGPQTLYMHDARGSARPAGLLRPAWSGR